MMNQIISKTPISNHMFLLGKSTINLHSPVIPGGTMICGLVGTKNTLGDNTAWNWMLLFEQGGDWEILDDDIRYQANEIQPWLPSAIFSSLAELEKTASEHIMADMIWFNDWATDAKQTLENSGLQTR